MTTPCAAASAVLGVILAVVLCAWAAVAVLLLGATMSLGRGAGAVLGR